MLSDGTFHTKASSVSRKISREKLEHRLSEYVAPSDPAIDVVLKEHQASILNEVAEVTNWQELRQAFSRHRLELKKRGNGPGDFYG